MITTPQAFLVRRSVRLGLRLGRRFVLRRVVGRSAPSPWRRGAPVALVLAGATVVVVRVLQARRSGGAAPEPSPAPGPTVPASASVDDDALAAAVIGALDDEAVQVEVDRGVVTLSGRVEGLARVASLVLEAERVEGVRAVRSELRDATPDARS